MKYLFAVAVVLAFAAYELEASPVVLSRHVRESKYRVTPEEAKTYADMYNIYMTNLENQQNKKGRALPAANPGQAKLFADLMNIYMDHLEKMQIKSGKLPAKGRGVGNGKGGKAAPSLAQGQLVGDIMLSFQAKA